MLECWAWRFWYCGLKYLMRNKNPLFWKSARVTCVFRCDLNRTIAWKCNNTRAIVRAFVCVQRTRFSFVVCLLWKVGHMHEFSIFRVACVQEIQFRGRLWLKTKQKALLEDGGWARPRAVERTQRCHSQRPTLQSLHRPQGIPTIQSHMARTNLTSWCWCFALKTGHICVYTYINNSFTIVSYKLMQVFNDFFIKASAWLWNLLGWITINLNLYNIQC